MTYKISEETLRKYKTFSDDVKAHLEQEIRNTQIATQAYKKAFEYLEELERYFYRIGGSTGEQLYYDVQKVRKEIEQALSLVLRQPAEEVVIDLLSRDNIMLFDLSGAEKLEEQLNKLFEAELVDRPREVGTAYKYPAIPLTYREELKKQGFVQGRRASEWLKDYKGYTIWCHEGTSRKRIEVQIRRGKELLSNTKIAYTEEQLFKIIKEFEEKIDKMRKDPHDNVTVNVDDSFDWNFMTEGMNSLDDQMNADVVKIIDYTKAHLDAFLRHDEGIEEWLNNMSEEGKLDIPAEYCDDYENVRDDEAFEYFKDLLTKTDLAAELDILRDTGEISNHQKIKRAFPKTNNSVTSHADAMSSGKQQMFNLVSSLRSDNGLSNRDILDIVQSVLGEGN